MDTPTSQFIPFGYSRTWSERDKYNVKGPIENAAEVRLALVGLGGVAVGKHLPAIRRLRDTGVKVSVVAGADVDPLVRTKVEEVNGFPCYADIAELLKSHEVDGALVLTDPGESRLKVMRQVVERGIHLFAEKPFLFLGVDRLPESIALARGLVKEAAARKLVVMTGFVKRFSPPYEAAQALIRQGAIGEPSLIAIKMCQGWSRHILLEGQACHVLHIARWLGGEIKGLQAFGINRYGEPNYPYDNITVNVEFESGAIGAFYFNSSSPSLKPWERVEVFGNRKWLVVEDGASVTLHDSEEGPSQTWSPVMPHTLFFDEEFSGFAGELRDFVQAVRGQKQPEVTGEDGIAALVLADMIHTSIRERRYVARSDVPVAVVQAA
jgi:predicted dehydrogenase